MRRADVHGGAVLRPGRPGSARKFGQAVERQVDFAGGAFAAIVADGLGEICGQLARVDQVQERDLRGQVAGDDRGFDFFAVSSTTPRARPFSTRMLLDRRVGSDLGAAAGGRFRDGVRDRAHAAAHESPQPALAADAAHDVMQQDVGGAGRARSAVRADDAVGGERDFDFVRFEPFVEEIGRALREDFHQTDDFFRGESAESCRAVSDSRRNRQAVRRKLGRRGEEQAFDHFGEPLQMIFVRRKHFGVVRGEFRDFGQGFGAILPHEEMAAVGKRREERGIFRVDTIAEAFEFEFANDALLQQAGEIRGGGDAIARPDFFGDRATAHQFALFEHQHFAPGAREVGGARRVRCGRPR